jgi:exo-1,4-beta-D-glucosaminidase
MNDSWGYHDAATGNGRYDNYYNDMVKRFGNPVGMEEFSDNMQLMNAMGYQGIFEAAQHRLTTSGGVMLWKLNAAFPSVVWQIYDWYMMPNAGYYFMQKSCDPVHIQLNLNDSVATIVNRYHKPVTGLTADLAVYSLNSERVFAQTATASLAAEETKAVLSLAGVLKQAKDIRLVLLKLKDASGHEISRNTYWLDPGKNLRPLLAMPRTGVELKIVKRNANTSWTIQVTNSTGRVAFFVRLQLMDGREEITPSLWSSNYITLAPGESVPVEVQLPGRYADLEPVIRVSGWNVDPAHLPTAK